MVVRYQVSCMNIYAVQLNFLDITFLPFPIACRHCSTTPELGRCFTSMNTTPPLPWTQLLQTWTLTFDIDSNIIKLTIHILSSFQYIHEFSAQSVQGQAHHIEIVSLHSTYQCRPQTLDTIATSNSSSSSSQLKKLTCVLPRPFQPLQVIGNWRRSGNEARVCVHTQPLMLFI